MDVPLFSHVSFPHTVFIDCEAGEIIPLVASVCLCIPHVSGQSHFQFSFFTFLLLSTSVFFLKLFASYPLAHAESKQGRSHPGHSLMSWILQINICFKLSVIKRHYMDPHEYYQRL